MPRFASRAAVRYAGLLCLLAAYLFVVRTYTVAATMWMFRDQIRDWQIALGPLSALPLTGPQSTAGGSSLGPVYYWVLWLSRHVYGPLVSNLPHAGVYGIATLQTLGDLLLLHALLRRGLSWAAALAAVLLAATASMDLAISATIWNPAVSVAFVKIALALRLLRTGEASRWWMAATTAAAWFAVQAHSAALFAAVPIVGSYVVEDLARGRMAGALERVRIAIEVVLVLQVPFLYHALVTRGETTPTRFLASASQSLGPGGRLRLIDSLRAVFSEISYILANPADWHVPSAILAVCLVPLAWRYRRDVPVLCVTIGALACAWVGFSLWQSAYDGYWYLPLVPCAALALAFGLTTVRPRETALVLLAVAIVAQPFRIQHAQTWLKMREYGPLVRGSKEILRHTPAIRRLDTAFPMPALSDAGFPFETMGGRFSSDADFDAVIDLKGDVQFRKVAR